MAHRNLNVLEASEKASDRVIALIEGPTRRRLLHATQIMRSAQAVPACIGEAFGRGPGRDRARILRIARGEAEETLKHLSSNFRANRITPGDYWPLQNLLVVIVKMLDSLILH